MNIRQRVPAGIIDSVGASVATFAVGVYAVRALDAAGLGIYSVFFSAFLMASVVPSSLVFTSARVRLLSIPAPQRLRAYSQTLRIGAKVAVPSALIVAIAIPSALSSGKATFIIPMTFTAYVAALLSPLQDHIRGLLHLGEASWGAATVSIVQAGVVALSIAVTVVLGANPVWTPFGALALANAVSLAVGVAIAHHLGENPPEGMLRFRDLSRSGNWFVATTLLSRGADFAARQAVIFFAAADILGVAEGARIAARPLGVFASGIAAVVTPRSMQIGRDGAKAAGQRLSKWTNLGVLASALLYTGVGGFSWPFNPIASLAPIGYTVAGLVPATIMATALQSMLFAERGQLMGGGRERTLTYIELVASVPYVLAGLLANMIGAFVIPLGITLMSATRWILYRVTLTRHYRRYADIHQQVSGASLR